MPENEREEGVYGENIPPENGRSDRGIRQETVEAHPNPTGDEAAAAEVADRGAESIETSQSVAQDLDNVREEAAHDTGSGGMGRDGMGRDGTPRNADDAPQGQFGDNGETQRTPG